MLNAKKNRRHSPFHNLKSTGRRARFESLENRSLLAGLVFPNDPQFTQQWPLHNIGQTGGLNDADIDMPAAWSVSTGSMSTVVAVLDSGIDYTHPDIYLNMWINESEIPAPIAANLTDADSDGLISFRDLNAAVNASYVTDLNGTGYIDSGDLLSDTRWENGLDDDANGFVDDLVGWDFHDDDNDPYASLAVADHGTHMSQRLAAMGNDGVGWVGVMWQARLMNVRINLNNGPGNHEVENCVGGIDYAVAEGASISNNSWVDEPYSQALYDAIDRARLQDHLFVAAAGNNSRDNDSTPFYPASYDLDNVISVAALNSSDQLSPVTNWGQVSVDLGSPSDAGTTSKATPLVTGVAGLLRTVHPDWTYTQIKDQILSTVDPIPALAGKSVTGGRLNAANALGVAQISISDATATEGERGLRFSDNFVSPGSGGLDNPRGITFGPDGNLYVGPLSAAQILRFNGSNGKFIDVFADGTSVANEAGLVVFHNGYLFTATGTGGVLRFDATTGEARPASGKPGALFVSHADQGITAGAHGFAFGPDEKIYLSSHLSNRILRYDGSTGEYLDDYVAPGSGGLGSANALVFGADGHLYAGDFDNNAVRRYQGPLEANPGTFIDIFVSPGSGGLTWIPAGGMSFGPDGDLYVSSRDTSSVLRFNGTSGAFVEAAVASGEGGLSGTGGITFDGDGLLYVSSQYSDEVLRYAPASKVVFTVRLSSTSAVPVAIDYATSNGTATAGSDYTASSGTLTFAPGQTSRTILVQTLDDAVYEGNETFTINLSNPVGGVIVDGQGVGTIQDNDQPPTKFYVVDDGSANRTFEYAANGSVVENYTVASGNTAPRGAASNAAGDKVWVVDANRNVYVYGPSGNPLGSWSVGGFNNSAQLEGISVSGNDVWIVDNKSDKVYRFTGAATRTSGSQSAFSSFSLNSGNKDASDLVTDGTSIWVLNNTTTDKVFKYTVSGTLQGSWTISGGGGSPTGITIDPSLATTNNSRNIWIVDNASDRVYQFDAAVGRTSGTQAPSTSFALNAAGGNTNPQGIADPPVSSAESSESSATGGLSSSASFDSALLAIIGELDGLLGSKKRK